MSHWDLLAQELGAEIQPQAEAPQAAPPPPPPRPKRTPAPRPQRAPTDWGRVANELGLEPPPAPLDEEPRPQKVSEAELGARPERTVEEPSYEAPHRERPSRPERREEAAVEEVLAEVVDEGEVVEAREERGRERGRKRRRRRRKRVESTTTEVRIEEIEQADAFEAVDVEGHMEIIDVEAEIVEEADGEREDEAGASEERRRRRRRRRGGKRRRSAEDREESSTATDGADEELAEAIEDAGEGEGDGEEEDEEGVALKGHRGIPSWDEAISLIINANMEARAKHPATDRGRGRGRGSGRSSGS